MSFAPAHFPMTFDPHAGVDAYLGEVAAWIRSEPVRFLLETIPAHPADGAGEPRLLDRPAALENDDPRVAIRALDQMCDWREHGTAWDIRHGVERQLVQETLVETGHSEAVIAAAEALGLRGAFAPRQKEVDVAISLGGARLAPLLRTRRLVQERGNGLRYEHLVLLGSARPLNEAELTNDDVREYAPGARTEFDLMVAAGVSEAGITAAPGEAEQAESQVDDHQSWQWRRWPGPPHVHAVSAPTTRPGFRADTADSLRFVAGGLRAVQEIVASVPDGDAVLARGGLGLQRGDRVLLCTSAIYQTFTQLVAVGLLGLQFGCRVETVAFPIDWNPAQPVNFQTASLYLQEVRSTFQNALRLLDRVTV